VTDAGVIVDPSDAHRISPLKPGDGVVFDAADWRSPEEPEEGGRLFQVAPRDGKLELRFGNGALQPARIRRGDLVWRHCQPHDQQYELCRRPCGGAAVCSRVVSWARTE